MPMDKPGRLAARSNPDETLPEVVRPLARGSASRLSLTVLFHPRVERIGMVADIPASSASAWLELGRLQPLFLNQRTGECSSLDDPYVSRSACRIAQEVGGCRITVPAGGRALSVAGRAVAGTCRLEESALERGVVLALSGRVALLLKRSTHLPLEPESCGLVGESDLLQRARRAILVAAKSEQSVLLLGETGTGKELAAQAIHRLSPRRDGPMVILNMAAIPEELAAAELFGVARGAFTGADSNRRGYFRAADGGTIFMDEIGECPPRIQPQLLRCLESGEVQVPGSGVFPVDVRVLTAADSELDEAANGFRAALKHRLDGICIRLPRLRERLEDIGRLWRAFIRAYEAEFDVVVYRGGRDPAEAAQWCALLARFAVYRWPGNVRELRNFCFQVGAHCHYHREFGVPESILRVLDEGRDGAADEVLAYRAPARVGTHEITEAMRQSNYEVAAAARRLNMSRSSLYNRLREVPGLRLVGDIPAAELREAHRRCGGNLERAAAMLAVSARALLRRWHTLELEQRRE